MNRGIEEADLIGTLVQRLVTTVDALSAISASARVAAATGATIDLGKCIAVCEEALRRVQGEQQ